MDRMREQAAAQAEVAQLSGLKVSEVAPSRRDFAMFVATQKASLAVLARLTPRSTPEELFAHARCCDDAEVAALVMETGAGLSIDDLAAVAAATTAPQLRTNLTIHPSQLYYARLHGTDAALFSPSAVDPPMLRELIAVASSLHMASVIQITAAREIDAMAGLPLVIAGLRCENAAGQLDVEGTIRLAEAVPRSCPIIVMPEIASIAECDALRGVCDAVTLGDALLQGADISSLVAQIQ